MYISHHVTNEDGPLSQCLNKHFSVDSVRFQELLSLGAIYSNKKRIFEDRNLKKGTYLRLHLKPKRFETSHIDWKKCLVHEDKDFIVVNKPVGVPTHASVDNVIENCLHQMRHHLKTELFSTQRLDIPVGGLLVFAKNKKFQSQFNEMLANRSVKKNYEAITENPVEVARYRHFMEPSEKAPKKMSFEEKEGWLSCELSVLSSEKIDQGYRLRVELHTGRTHQIRAQLALLGAPIIGDFLYQNGIYSKKAEGANIKLRCEELGWKTFHFKI